MSALFVFGKRFVWFFIQLFAGVFIYRPTTTLEFSVICIMLPISVLLACISGCIRYYPKLMMQVNEIWEEWFLIFCHNSFAQFEKCEILFYDNFFLSFMGKEEKIAFKYDEGYWINIKSTLIYFKNVFIIEKADEEMIQFLYDKGCIKSLLID